MAGFGTPHPRAVGPHGAYAGREAIQLDHQSSEAQGDSRRHGGSMIWTLNLHMSFEAHLVFGWAGIDGLLGGADGESHETAHRSPPCRLRGKPQRRDLKPHESSQRCCYGGWGVALSASFRHFTNVR